jgi:hypothetical protein
MQSINIIFKKCIQYFFLIKIYERVYEQKKSFNFKVTLLFIVYGVTC